MILILLDKNLPEDQRKMPLDKIQIDDKGYKDFPCVLLIRDKQYVILKGNRKGYIGKNFNLGSEIRLQLS